MLGWNLGPCICQAGPPPLSCTLSPFYSEMGSHQSAYSRPEHVAFLPQLPKLQGLQVHTSLEKATSLEKDLHKMDVQELCATHPGALLATCQGVGEAQPESRRPPSCPLLLRTEAALSDNSVRVAPEKRQRSVLSGSAGVSCLGLVVLRKSQLI